MKGVLELLCQEPYIATLEKGGKTFVCDANEAEALVFAATFKHSHKTTIIIKNNLYGAQTLYESLSNLLEPNQCVFFPSDESFRIEALASSKELVAQRLYVMAKLMTQQPSVVVAHTASVVRFLPSVDVFKQNCLKIKLNDTLKVNDLIDKLVLLGYERVNMIEHSLQLAKRGGVLDIYSVNYEHPVRIEFFGDDVDSIRFFDLETQKTIETTKEITIIPATDLVVGTNYETQLQELLTTKLSDKAKEDLLNLKDNENYTLLYKYYTYFQPNIVSIVNYLPSDTLTIVSNLDFVQENYKMLANETLEYLEEEGNASLHLLLDLSSVLESNKCTSYVNEFRQKNSDIAIPIYGVDEAYGNTRVINEIITGYSKDNQVVLCVENKNQLDCLMSWAKDWGYSLPFVKANELPKAKISYTELALKTGFRLEKQKLVYLGAKDLFGIHTISKGNLTRYRSSQTLQSYENLHVGDYVIHETHGIGRFLGIEEIETDGIHRDYLHIAYRGEGVLYVPLEQFRLIRKYVSREGAEPRLNKLGSEEWKKTKSRIKQRISDIADRLMLLYSDRVEKSGYAFVKDDEWQHQFEAAFPFELTEDQITSVNEIKHDMESPFPMDRLLCGDVGFGKTEVAFIAAFKAIMSGKQVAFLCPTTLLSQQHYDNAVARFRNFPVNIGLLNRYVPEKKQQEYLEQLANGSLHLIIGTHRLLSKDVKFKDLGLLIVDEEQRFGVEHKEKIKELKTNIDVLTLTATPIPRTLQMSLVGIRSLSQINTPPLFRMPIQTYVIEKNMKLIREIIERELARKGQVFYLYNKISTISSVASDIERNVKGAKVIVVHGKMTREETEEAMMRFHNQEANVMVCTTIVENGIDIPNANTIIIEDADRFGLSQLYQIKGRVGRSDRLAYAYLLYRPKKQISEIATKRLRAIKEFAELGSGYKIAMRDLTIRGAGDILGAEQSGFIDMVGIETYIRLLNEAISERKSGIPTPEIEIHQPLHLDAYINKGFTEDLDKINLYQKIDEVQTLKQLKSLYQDIEDIYGKIPQNVVNLLEKRRLELFETQDIVASTKDNKDQYEVVFSDDFATLDGIGISLFKITGETSPQITLQFRNDQIRMIVSKKDSLWLEHTITVLEKMKEVVKEYKDKK